MLQTGFSTQFVWEMLILDWGDFAALGRIPWTSITLPIMSGIIGAFVQIFFAWYISYTLLDRFLPLFLTIYWNILGAFTSSNKTASGNGLLSSSFSALAFAIQWAIVGPEKGVHLVAGCTAWLAGSAACDVIITLTMIKILYSAKTKMTFDRTNHMLDKLISRSIQSGAFTSVFAVIELVLFLTESQNYLHVSIAIFLSKLLVL
ncbi:hypothetical protein H2248_011247 [Termitomyces sp. 'cryptogamus']|nr:hypothetical protein H2248_011247 [Termitomyces sp. 'cryptogamus']